MSSLTESIKELYNNEATINGIQITDGEASLATNNLLGFFKLLQGIDTRLQDECVKHQYEDSLLQNKTHSHDNIQTSECKAFKPRTKNKRSDLANTI